MRKLFLFFFCFLTGYISIGQANSPEFDSLYKRAMELYDKKDFKNSAFTFSIAFRLPNVRPSMSHRYNCACSWSLANYLDSAFYQLDLVAGSKELTFMDASDLIGDRDFNTLHGDARWEALKEKMFSLLYKKYVPAGTIGKKRKNKIRLSVDQGHNGGAAFAVVGPVLTRSGFEISAIKEKLTAASLANTDLLLIGNPLPEKIDSLYRWAEANHITNDEFRWSSMVARPAYTDEEAAAVKQWVEHGGSLWLILDHAPYPMAGSPITKAFGIDCPNVSTYDSLSRDPISDTTGGARSIIFTRSKGSIGKHPILNGVDSVTTYTGNSIIGPPNSIPLLKLSATAYNQDWDFAGKKYRWRSAAGRIQGFALELGKGKMVMLGEARMMTPDGISVSNRGNWQMFLNILKWLTSDLK